MIVGGIVTAWALAASPDARVAAWASDLQNGVVWPCLSAAFALHTHGCLARTRPDYLRASRRHSSGGSYEPCLELTQPCADTAHGVGHNAERGGQEQHRRNCRLVILSKMEQCGRVGAMLRDEVCQSGAHRLAQLRSASRCHALVVVADQRIGGDQPSLAERIRISRFSAAVGLVDCHLRSVRKLGPS